MYCGKKEQRKMKRMVIFVLLSCIILTGCWDKRLLKEHSLILAVGYDLNDDNTISKTVAFPQEKANSESQSEDKPNGKTETLTSTGNTVGDSDIKLEQVVSQKFDRSKARILLIGGKLAKKGIFPTLDTMYRDPRGPLGASVAIVSDRAEDGLNIKET